MATSVSGHSVIVKKISLPAPSDEGLAESIHWEAAQHIPFDIADVSVDYQVLGESTGAGNLELLLVAVKKEKIADRTGVITMAGKNPVVVDVDAFALQNAYEINYTPMTRAPSALVDIGASITTINIVSGTDLLFTRGVAVGGHQYTDFIRKEFNLGLQPGSGAETRPAGGRDRTLADAPRDRFRHRDHLPGNSQDRRFFQDHDPALSTSIACW